MTISRPSTFSIAAYDPDARCWGVAVASKFLAAGNLVPWARAGAGAVATQAFVNTSYGFRGLDIMSAGKSAAETVKILTSEDSLAAQRQVGMVDASGKSAAFTGDECLPYAGHITGQGFSCQGNLLAGKAVLEAMAETFSERGSLPFSERLLEALTAGQAAGGDSRGRQSAALIVVKEKGGYGGWTDRLIDLRADDHPTPIVEVKRLLALHQLYFGETKQTVQLSGDILHSVRNMLAKLGYYKSQNTYYPDQELIDALEAYCGTENLEMRRQGNLKLLDVEILRFMEQQAKSRY